MCESPFYFHCSYFAFIFLKCMDFGLHRSVASALKVHQLAQDKMSSQNRQYELEVKQCLDNFDSRADKKKFIEAFNSLFMLPKKFDLSAQIGDEVRQRTVTPMKKMCTQCV